MKAFILNTILLIAFIFLFSLPPEFNKKYMAYTVKQHMKTNPEFLLKEEYGRLELEQFLNSLPNEQTKELFIHLSKAKWVVLAFQILFLLLFSYLITKVNKQKKLQ